MILIVLSVVLFVITLPIKTVKLGIDTSRKVNNLKDRLHDTLYENRQEKSTEEKIQDAKNKVKKTGRFAIRVIKKSVITLLRFIRISAVFLFSIGLLWSLVIIMTIMFLISTAGYVVAMQENGIDVTNIASSVSVGSNDSKDNDSKKTGSSKVAKGEIKEALESLSKWMVDNVPTYQSHRQDGYPPSANASANPGTVNRSESGVSLYKCDLVPGGEVGDDCSSFAVAYMNMVCGECVLARDWTGGLISPTHAFSQHGWVYHKCSELSSINDLQYGDVLVAHGPTYGVKQHAEIFMSPTQSMGWGYVHNQFPVAKTFTLSNGLVYDTHGYYAFWRYEGK